ncbi:hypothetical protein OAC86_00835 [bacterium]|jgi:hypothetical protein|nr:hypothetical protein [bacterium]MDB9900069.1 hypothetical protein [bacterium]|tara:strand:+ start:476 stop:655 length:180 start_codon:yes stop_codon:yes gene_type:complete
MTLTELSTRTKALTIKYPVLKQELIELYILACDEVEEGGSETHECELAIADMDQLIEEL